jgi:hypothetical protein
MGQSVVHVAEYDHDASPALLNLKSFHILCFVKHIAGKNYIFYDQLKDSDEGRVGKVCSCNMDVGRKGCCIFETNSDGKQMWVQFFHTECFLENAGENFFK